MRNPRRGVPGREGTSRSARLPVLGLVMVILMLSVFASAMAVTSKRATDHVARGERSRADWQQAVGGLRNEMLLSQRYLAQPSSGVRYNLRANGTQVTDALIRLDSDGTDLGTVARFAATHQRYRSGIERLITAADNGDQRGAERIQNDELVPISSGLLFTAEQALAHRNRVNNERLRSLSRLQTTGMATPVVFGIGLLLIALFWRVLRSYQRDMEQQAHDNEHQALHDALTGLGNRTLLLRRIEKALILDSERQTSAALMLLDLDRFKEVNDTLGHHCGDQLLQHLAGRLRTLVRDGDTLVRLGGDEFAAIMPGADLATAETISARLLAALTEPVTLDGVVVSVDGSIGIAVYPDHADTGDELMRRADIAMYTAKESHAGFVVYDSGLDKRDTRRLGLLGELRRALEQRELVVHYQPKAKVNGGRVFGAEALVRWQHPRHGLLGPYEFIPLAERTGLITSVTQYVLHDALQQVRSWLDAGTALAVSVNVPTRCLLDLDFADEVARQLDASQVPAEQLILEITEGTIMQDPDRSIHVLHQLRALGVGLSIDDFGTGYSSMAYLKNLPVHELKVDRSFVSQMSVNASDKMIVASTIDLGHNLGLKVVAEGVEDQATWDQLQQLGCDDIQGFYLARPMPAQELTTWLTDANVSNAPGKKPQLSPAATRQNEPDPHHQARPSTDPILDAV